jgi:hypothetical protein
VNSRASSALGTSLLLTVLVSTPSFCGDTASNSVSSTVGKTSLQPTPANQTVKVAKQVSAGTFDITVNDGTTYRKCRIIRVEPDGITLLHSKGVAKIEFPDLPEEYSEAYGYDPAEAEEYSLAAEKRQDEFAARQQKEGAQQGATSENQEEEPVVRIGGSQGGYSASFNLLIDDPVIVYVPGYGYCNWIFMNRLGRRGPPWRPMRFPRPIPPPRSM